ncbi:Chloride channel protein [Vigna angularis]|uniref:Chloride channel protein n=1 Tax=Phaseolus angularis TaxID=3914 RepID=A0A8T0JUU6_PHAAN|nr:Chloride channel protein [Vigna angularis]
MVEVFMLNFDLAMPTAPDLGRRKHTTAATHVTEGGLANTVRAAIGDARTWQSADDPATFLVAFDDSEAHYLSEAVIIETCLVSILTSVISFGLPLLRKCTPCPESDPASGIECPQPPGISPSQFLFFSLLSRSNLKATTPPLCLAALPSLRRFTFLFFSLLSRSNLKATTPPFCLFVATTPLLRRRHLSFNAAAPFSLPKAMAASHPATPTRDAISDLTPPGPVPFRSSPLLVPVVVTAKRLCCCWSSDLGVRDFNGVLIGFGG